MERSIGQWILATGLSGALAVAAGAFAAHGLERTAGETELAAFRTGALYHLLHSVALLGIAALTPLSPNGARTAGIAFVAGIVLFSGSLYFLGLTGSRALVLITPLGGLSFIAGWIVLAVTGWRLTRKT